MDRLTITILIGAVFVLLVALMYFGWRARGKRQAGIPAPASVPTELGTVIGDFEGQYVATTHAGDPFDRITAHGLGFRAHATISVSEAGLVVSLPGRSLFIAANAITELRRATWTIDRGVEDGGLQVVAWSLGETSLDSYFRMQRPTEFETAVLGTLKQKQEREPS